MYTYFVAPLKTILSHSLIFSFVSRKKETERVTTRSMFSRYVSSSLSRIVEMPDKIIVDISQWQLKATLSRITDYNRRISAG